MRAFVWPPSALLLALLVWICPAEAALQLRIVAEPTAELSTASRFGLIVETFDTGTHQRVLTNGLQVSLDLFRCPGHPNSCSVQLVDGDFATATTTAGLALFSNLVIPSAATDAYLSATATGYAPATTLVRDVARAHVHFAPLPDLPVSTASQLPLHITIRRGPSPNDPVDLLADGLLARLGMSTCPGYPSSCLPTPLDPDLAEFMINNGQATLGNWTLSSAGEDRYFTVVIPDGSATYGSSRVSDVTQATLRSPDPSVLRFVSVPFDYPLEIALSPDPDSAPDPRADGVDVRLRLASCVGYPENCTPITHDTNFANATAFNGVATFAGLVMGTSGEDRYFVLTAPNSTGMPNGIGTVFDVEIDPYVFSDGLESQ